MLQCQKKRKSDPDDQLLVLNGQKTIWRDPLSEVNFNLMRSKCPDILRMLIHHFFQKYGVEIQGEPFLNTVINGILGINKPFKKFIHLKVTNEQESNIIENIYNIQSQMLSTNVKLLSIVIGKKFEICEGHYGPITFFANCPANRLPERMPKDKLLVLSPLVAKEPSKVNKYFAFNHYKLNNNQPVEEFFSCPGYHLTAFIETSKSTNEDTPFNKIIDFFEKPYLYFTQQTDLQLEVLELIRKFCDSRITSF